MRCLRTETCTSHQNKNEENGGYLSTLVGGGGVGGPWSCPSVYVLSNNVL